MEERRNRLRRPARAVAVLAGALLLPLPAPAAGCELGPGTRLESKNFLAAYRTLPAAIPQGRHFTLEFSVCPRAGIAAPSPAALRLDAHMPEHRHGMNYRPSVKAAGPGRFTSEGWLFHMPGRWEFVFDVAGERLTHSVRVE